MGVDQEEWDKIWHGVAELSETFERRLVFIGGVAVYLHVKQGKLPGSFVEFSHDGDMYVSLDDYPDLRDLENTRATRRLAKYQFKKRGVDFDVYLEKHSELIVSYADVAADSIVVDGVRIASLEHLLLLKLDAYHDRRTSDKGDKDRRDLLRIMYLLTGPRRKVAEEPMRTHMTEELQRSLAAIARSNAAFMAIADGNAHDARKVRKRFLKALEQITEARR